MERFLFKKIELWIVILVGILIISIVSIGVFSIGVLAMYKNQGGKNYKRISEISYKLVKLPFKIRQNTMFHPMEVWVKRGEGVGFEQFKESSVKGHILLSRYSFEDNQSIIELIDLDNFNVLHKWAPDTDSFFRQMIKRNGQDFLPKHQRFPNYFSLQRKENVHPLLLKNGHLIYVSPTLTEINSKSDLVSQKEDLFIHHCIEEDIDGNFWACATKFNDNVDYFYADAIVKLSRDKEVLFYRSVNDIFRSNNMTGIINGLGHSITGNDGTLDPMHINDVLPVPDDGPYWKKGDVFISLRNLSMVMLYRPDTDKIIWKKIGMSISQHDIDIINDSQISIFSNNTPNFIPNDGYVNEGYFSEILIYDFDTDTVSSPFREAMQKHEIFTFVRGAAHVFEDGSAIIEESQNGRLLMLDSDGDIVWQFMNEAKNGKRYRLAFFRVLENDIDLSFLSKK